MKIGYRLDDQKIDGSLDNLEKELESLKNFGLHCVELPMHGLDVVKNSEIDSRVLKGVKEILGSYDFEYTAHCADSINMMDEENIDDNLKLFESSLEFCRQIKSNIFVYHPGKFIPEEQFMFNYKTEMPESGKATLLKMERLYIKNKADKYQDVRICMENARPYRDMAHYCYAEDINLLAEQVKDIACANVGITLDTGHLNLSANYYKYDIIKAIEDVKKHIYHVHLHDNFGKTCYYHEKRQTHLIPLGKGDCHMPIGLGNAPIKSIIDSIKDNYEGYFVFEYRSRYKELLQESINNLNVIMDNR